MIDKHKDDNKAPELVDELEALFFRYAVQIPILTVIFVSFKMEIRKSETNFSACAIPIITRV